MVVHEYANCAQQTAQRAQEEALAYTRKSQLLHQYQEGQWQIANTVERYRANAMANLSNVPITSIGGTTISNNSGSASRVQGSGNSASTANSGASSTATNSANAQNTNTNNLSNEVIDNQRTEIDNILKANGIQVNNP